jgi:serine protease Do
MLLGGALSLLLVGTGFMLGSRRGGALDPVQQIAGTTDYSSVNASSGGAIVNAVKRVGPAVMNVDTRFGGGGSREFLPDPSEMGPRSGKGTGVIIDSKRGLMLTNAHVVSGAEQIQVTAPDGKKYSGRLIGSDPSNDIALVELSNKKLPQARLASFTDPKQLRIGEWAIAIGNPFAQENTVTVGVVSAVGRQVGPAPMPGKPGQSITLTDMIQTDAAINPGNSGGPLCNINGEVIGINTAILPVGQGLGFTIPINKAKAVADTLLRNGGKVPYIGIRMLPVDAKSIKDFALKEKSGVFVQQVEEKSPAERAGLAERRRYPQGQRPADQGRRRDAEGRSLEEDRREHPDRSLALGRAPHADDENRTASRLASQF